MLKESIGLAQIFFKGVWGGPISSPNLVLLKKKKKKKEGKGLPHRLGPVGPALGLDPWAT